MGVSKYIINESTLTGLASAIRAKTGASSAFTPAMMIDAINNLPSGGLSYGDYVVPMSAYKSAYWNIPNSFPEARAVLPDAFYQVSQYVSTIEQMYFPKCEYIGENAFYWCPPLKSFFASNVTYIAERAFGFCSSLQTTDISKATYFGRYAFTRCTSLSQFSFPSSAESITFDEGAFYNAGIESLTISNSSSAPVYLGSSAFQGCQSLSIVDIGFAQFKGNSVFEQCGNLVSFHASVGTYDQPTSSCFFRCGKLTDVSIDGLRYILEGVFGWCYALSRISLPTVQVIYGCAFSNCSSLTEVYLLSTSKVILSSAIAWNNATIPASSAFYKTPLRSGTGHIYVPSSLYSEYYNDSAWSWYRSVLTSYTEQQAL